MLHLNVIEIKCFMTIHSRSDIGNLISRERFLLMNWSISDHITLELLPSLIAADSSQYIPLGGIIYPQLIPLAGYYSY